MSRGLGDVYKRQVGRIAKDCAEREDETGKKVVKILFALILVSQILLGIDAISDVIERRK